MPAAETHLGVQIAIESLIENKPITTMITSLRNVAVATINRLIRAPSNLETLQKDVFSVSEAWEQQIRARFPDWNTPEMEYRWYNYFGSERRCYLWDRVQGEVIARAPFGVWVDVDNGFPIDRGIPVLMNATDMLDADRAINSISDFPAIGSTVFAEITDIDVGKLQIRIRQISHENFG